jgi:hypothetical protein
LCLLSFELLGVVVVAEEEELVGVEGQALAVEGE